MPKKISAAAPGTDASARDAGSDKHDEYLHYAEHCLAMARLAPDQQSRVIQREISGAERIANALAPSKAAPTAQTMNVRTPSCQRARGASFIAMRLGYVFRHEPEGARLPRRAGRGSPVRAAPRRAGDLDQAASFRDRRGARNTSRDARIQ
jgi:hypothetical protein